MEWYKQDLAYIHDVGHSDYALKSAPGILSILAENHIHDGLIVDLGCGSGLSALEFTAARYQVLGIDISESMIALARTRVPSAEFRVESLFETQEEYYRRDDEVHRLQLYKATEVAEQLHQVGFQVQIMRRYGDYDLPQAHAAFVARKPLNAERT